MKIYRKVMVCQEIRFKDDSELEQAMRLLRLNEATEVLFNLSTFVEVRNDIQTEEEVEGSLIEVFDENNNLIMLK